ncbi:glycosyltransferase family 2 protein [Pedobacter sp. ok626]|uniref:glycosyltransferase family 2 protein n=1 Tax=Pedobacter sp. ok626 TaxID=1761882 RepID=UPI0020C929E5|nr:glycosyltransferase family 2 protein [Pedobacter sp. ok626]
MMKKSLSVIIPNYNGRHLLEAYLPSVLQAVKKAAVPYEIIVIDDGSKDQSVDFIKQHYPEILLLINDKNRGFSYTCNQGIKTAQYALTFLLNSDVRLTEDYFEQQWKYFQHEDTFGVMGRIMSADGSKIEDAARILFRKGCRLKANRFYFSTDPNEESTYTAYLSGANALVDTKKLKKLNGFDEIYSPFSSEDSDLCLRAWLVGWKCYYEHRSICFHQVSGSTKTQIKSEFIKKIYYRNRFIFHKIHLNGFRGWIWPTYLLLLEVLPKLILGKSWMMTSYKEYLQHIPQIKASRANIVSLKRKHGSELNVQDIIDKINHSISNKNVVFL